MRHLLTHTAGVGYWRRLSDLLQPGVGSGNRAGRTGAPPLADYYRAGLPVEVEPGTKWAYSNHGFAALGQLVEDVSGQPFDQYLRDQVFDPLGMDHTDLARYVAALLQGGAGEHGPVLKADTLAGMFQLDPRAPGWGWASSSATRAATAWSATAASSRGSCPTWS